MSFDNISLHLIGMEAVYSIGIKKIRKAFIISQLIKKEALTIAKKENLKFAIGFEVPEFNLKGIPLVDNTRAASIIS